MACHLFARLSIFVNHCIYAFSHIKQITISQFFLKLTEQRAASNLFVCPSREGSRPRQPWHFRCYLIHFGCIIYSILPYLIVSKVPCLLYLPHRYLLTLKNVIVKVIVIVEGVKRSLLHAAHTDPLCTQR